PSDALPLSAPPPRNAARAGSAASAAPAPPKFATLAADPDLDPPTRLAFVDRSLDRIERGQIATLSAVDRAALAASDRNTAILADAGLDAATLAARRPERPLGGPYVPLDAGASAFDRAAARAARDLAFAAKLEELMPSVPLGRPLAGDAPVASPFGYRIDPFLGRPELHPGVDLVQDYGAQIRAAGAGRVVHAGFAGGYGLVVEIDHGEGLTTRYAHLSETTVGEGDEVEKGAVVGKLGSTGRSTGPHLHYEVRIDGEPVDPERFLRAGTKLAAQ
ncbi:MAG TPA: M23 family metallopeptidase, partial [Roseiarcus sp.]|nr:M23 family metallopeptidase [Roseiarcus sp.]